MFILFMLSWEEGERFPCVTRAMIAGAVDADLGDEMEIWSTECLLPSLRSVIVSVMQPAGSGDRYLEVLRVGIFSIEVMG